MRKPILSLMLILCTAVCTLGMVWKTPEKAVEARIVTVQRGDVHQVVAVSGRLSYTDEAYVYAATGGVVSQICVEAGERVGAGEALIRFEASQREAAVSAFLAEGADEKTVSALEWFDRQTLLDQTVLRAASDGTVRQVLVDVNMPVAAGTPVVRLTSGQQEIVCSISAMDAEKISKDMWAWISAGGESLGFAVVTSVGELTADAATGMTSVLVTLQPEKHIDLPEGASVDADVYLAGSDDVLTLPVEAITERDTVWWVHDGRCTEIPAEIVMTDEMLAWVALPEGTEVAVGEFEEGQYVVEASP